MPAKSGLGQNGRAIAVVKTANLICYVGVTPEGRYRRILSGERDGEQRMRRDSRIETASARHRLDAAANARAVLLTLGAPMQVRRRLRWNTFAVPAIRELIASVKHRPVPVALLNHLAHQTNGALTQGSAFDRLVAHLIPGYLAKFPDIAGRLAAVGDEIYAPAGARERDVEQASFFSIGEGFRLGNDQVEQFIVLDAARHAIIAFTHIKQNRVVRLKPFSPVKGLARTSTLAKKGGSRRTDRADCTAIEPAL